MGEQGSRFAAELISTFLTCASTWMLKLFVRSASGFINNSFMQVFPQEVVSAKQSPMPEWMAAAANPGVPFSPPKPMQTAALCNKDIDALVQVLAKNSALGERLPKLLHWLQDCDHAFDARLCTTFISAYVRAGSPFMGLQLFHWMLAESRVNLALLPTVHTYIAAIRAASAAEAFSQVNQIWKLAQQAHMSSDERLTSAYMAALFRVNKHSQVRQLFEDLRNRSAEAPPQAYVLAMRSLTKSGCPEEALALWRELQETTGFQTRAVPCPCSITVTPHSSATLQAHAWQTLSF
jgi:pentatricopeptide repeat protein